MTEYYSVERILDKKIIDGNLKYLIKWVGYPKSQATWEPATNLDCIKYMIDDFEKLINSTGLSQFGLPSNIESNKKSAKKQKISLDLLKTNVTNTESNRENQNFSSLIMNKKSPLRYLHLFYLDRGLIH